MDGPRLVQLKNGAKTTIAIVGGTDVRVEYEGKNKRSLTSQIFRLSDLYPRGNRIPGYDQILPWRGWVVLCFSVAILFPGLRAYQTPSLLDNEEALAQFIIFTFGGLIGIGAMIREIVVRRKNSSGSFVFFHLRTRQSLFAFWADEPTENAAAEFCKLLELQIEESHQTIGDPNPSKIGKTREITSEMENLCTLFERGVISEVEFSKAKGILLKESW